MSSRRLLLDEAARKTCQAGGQLHLALASGRLQRATLTAVERLLREAQEGVKTLLDPDDRTG